MPKTGAKVEIPDGMSKNAWKKALKRQRWEENKEEYRVKRRQKKIAARQRRTERKLNPSNEGDGASSDKPRKPIPAIQSPTNVRVIMDCEFDDLMSEKEIVSLSNQITRCYSAKRHSTHDVSLTISTCNKRLRQRFETTLPDHSKWKGITFETNDSLNDILPKDPSERSKVVYLTADTDVELEELRDGETYIIGGIVDKNRHKRLCLDKANELGLRVARLPIGKYIKMNGRQVLATSHVYEIMCMWFEQQKNWEKAFNEVLPPRKLVILSDSANSSATNLTISNAGDSNEQLPSSYTKPEDYNLEDDSESRNATPDQETCRLTKS